MDLVYLGQLVLNALMLGVIYSLIALGFTLIFGIARVVNFAHGEIFMMSSFVMYYLMTALGLPGMLAIIACALIMAGVGLVLERGLFRRLRPQEVGTAAEFPSVIITLALILIIPASVVAICGTKEKAIPSLISGVIMLGPIPLSAERLLIVIVGLALFVSLLFFIWRHKEGRALSAAAQDSEAALLQGVNLNRAASVSFSIGFGLAAVAGSLLAPIYYVEPTMGPSALLKTCIVVILGGIGSIPGTLLGGLIFGFIESFGRAFLSGSFPMLIAFGIVMLVLIIRPRGLLGHD